mmetsp:Transcript_12872/g.28368  ORF Transcript_12872/g.28368 Transcript_12872/m.28368 type:complete len:253 (-) Transcript_12872:2-760(-)
MFRAKAVWRPTLPSLLATLPILPATLHGPQPSLCFRLGFGDNLLDRFHCPYPSFCFWLGFGDSLGLKCRNERIVLGHLLLELLSSQPRLLQRLGHWLKVLISLIVLLTSSLKGQELLAMNPLSFAIFCLPHGLPKQLRPLPWWERLSSLVQLPYSRPLSAKRLRDVAQLNPQTQRNPSVTGHSTTNMAGKFPHMHFFLEGDQALRSWPQGCRGGGGFPSRLRLGRSPATSLLATLGFQHPPPFPRSNHSSHQ